jgi:hypothetical protein
VAPKTGAAGAGSASACAVRFPDLASGSSFVVTDCAAPAVRSAGLWESGSYASLYGAYPRACTARTAANRGACDSVSACAGSVDLVCASEDKEPGSADLCFDAASRIAFATACTDGRSQRSTDSACESGIDTTCRRCAAEFAAARHSEGTHDAW